MSNKALNFITQLTRDIVNLFLSFFLVIWIAPLHTQEPIEKYFLPYLCFTLAWILVAIIMGRYKVPIKEQGYIPSINKAFNTTVLVYAITFSVIYFTQLNYSVLVFLIISLCIFGFLFIVQSLYFAILYASDPEDDVRPVEKREPKSLITKPEVISDEAYKSRKEAMVKWMGERAFQFMEEKVGINMNTTKVLATTEIFNIEETTPYKYDTIINVRSLNNIRGINKILDALGKTKISELEYMQLSSVDANFRKGYTNGINFVNDLNKNIDKYRNIFSSTFNNPIKDKIPGLGPTLGGSIPEVNVNNVKGGKISLDDDSIKWLNEEGAVEFVNRYTTLRPVLRVSFGDVHETADVNQIIDELQIRFFAYHIFHY